MDGSNRYTNIVDHAANQAGTVTTTSTLVLLSTFGHSSTIASPTVSSLTSTPSTSTIYVAPSATAPAPPSSASQKALIGGIIAAICVLAVLGIGVALCIHQRNRKRSRDINELERPPPVVLTEDGRRVLSDVTIVYDDKQVSARPTQQSSSSSGTTVVPNINPVLKPSKSVTFKKEEIPSSANQSIGQDSATLPVDLTQSSGVRDSSTTISLPLLGQTIKNTLQDEADEGSLFNMRKNTFLTDESSIEGILPAASRQVMQSKSTHQPGPASVLPFTAASQDIDETFQQSSVYIDETPPPTSATFFSHWQHQTNKPAPPLPNLTQDNQTSPRNLEKRMTSRKGPSSGTAWPDSSTTQNLPVDVLSNKAQDKQWDPIKFSVSQEDSKKMRHRSFIKGATTAWYGAESDEE